MSTSDPQQGPSDFNVPRTRTKTACLECRDGKRKCDGQVPRGPCQSRGIPDHCDYQPVPRQANEAEKKKRAESRAKKQGGQQQRHRTTQIFRSGPSVPAQASVPPVAAHASGPSVPAQASGPSIPAQASGPSCAPATVASSPTAAVPAASQHYLAPFQPSGPAQMTPQYLQNLPTEAQHHVYQLIASGHVVLAHSPQPFPAPAPASQHQPQNFQSPSISMAQNNTFTLADQQGYPMLPPLGTGQPDPSVHPFSLQTPSASGSCLFQQQNHFLPQAQAVVLNQDQQQNQVHHMAQQYSQPPTSQAHYAVKQPQTSYGQQQLQPSPISQAHQNAQVPQTSYGQQQPSPLPKTDMFQFKAQHNPRKPTPSTMYESCMTPGPIAGPSGCSNWGHPMTRSDVTPSASAAQGRHAAMSTPSTPSKPATPRQARPPVDDLSASSNAAAPVHRSANRPSLAVPAASEAGLEMNFKPKPKKEETSSAKLAETEQKDSVAQLSRSPEASTSSSPAGSFPSSVSQPLTPENLDPRNYTMPAFQPKQFTNGLFGASNESSEQPDIMVPTREGSSESIAEAFELY